MALPGIKLPSTLPAWRLVPHDTELLDVYADVPMSTGPGRKRRVFTTAPRIRDVELLLRREQMAAFHAWFETVLHAGTEQFAAEVLRLGKGLEWWTARFFSDGQSPPYQAEPLHRGFWRVSARLLLTGETSTTAPVMTSMAADILVPLDGSAHLAITPMLAADITVSLTGNVTTPMRADILVPLDGVVVVTSAVLQETGDALLLESGDRLLQES